MGDVKYDGSKRVHDLKTLSHEKRSKFWNELELKLQNTPICKTGAQFTIFYDDKISAKNVFSLLLCIQTGKMHD